MTIARDTNRVDILWYRDSLSQKLLSEIVRYKNLHKIMKGIIEKLKADVGPLNGLPVRQATCIINWIASGQEVQRLCKASAECLDSVLSHTHNLVVKDDKDDTIKNGKNDQFGHMTEAELPISPCPVSWHGGHMVAAVMEASFRHVQEYADALAAIGEPVKDKDLVMLAVSSLREEYNGLKTTITARQSPTAFSELHALLSDHDYMLGKTHALAPSITSSFAANYAVGSPSMPEALSPIAPSGPQAFHGVRPSNNHMNNNNNNRGNRNNSRGNNNNLGCGNGRQFDWASTQNTMYDTCNRCGIGHIPSQCPNHDPSTIRTRPSANFANTRAQSSNASANWHSDTGANSHVTPNLEAMDNLEAYYGDDALHVGNEISHNLLSVQKFCHDNDVFFEFHTSYFVVKDESTHTTLLTGPSKHGLYTITLPQLKSVNKVSFSAVRASPNHLA
ncbi:hypothetical protein Tco_0728161 [Tanacetum coccineum]|uniref:Uncharacterized protein n=1 Tax=Tanacetum coccineum TaxID=301880 RepID=A0ABQ4YMQ5_9ASTR